MASRQPLSLRNMLLIVTGMLSLMILLLVSREIYTEWQRMRHIQTLKQSTFLSERMFDVIETFSIERDIAFSILYTTDDDILHNLRPRLQEIRQKLDKELELYLNQIDHYPLLRVQELGKNTFKELEKIHQFRQKIDQEITHPSPKRKTLADAWFKESTAFASQLTDLWMEFTRNFVDIDPIVTQRMMFTHMLGMVMEYAARQRAIVSALIVSSRTLTPQEQSNLLQWQGIISQGWDTIRKLSERSQLAPAITPYLNDAESHYSNVYDMVKDAFYAQQGAAQAAYPIDIELWMELANQVSDSFYSLKDNVLLETRDYVQQLEIHAWQSIIGLLVFLLLSVGLCIFSFQLVLFRVLQPVETAINALVDTMEGKTVMFIPEYLHRQDEIGKLMKVLHAFQENTETVKRTAHELQNYANALERSNKELDDFAYIASHDLKEPLRGIHNHSRFLLEDNAERLDKDSVGRLERLIYLSQRMEKLVNDLLYFSRLGRQELAIQPTDLNEVIHDIEDTLDVFLEERNARITIPVKLPTITCDKPRITEVFSNLITNAVNYNDKPERQVEIGFSTEKKAFYVKDNGVGIAPEFYEEVFRIFKRLQSSKIASEEGTGAGLTFVKKIIERHGGKIWPESKMGVGTVFYFTLEG